MVSDISMPESFNSVKRFFELIVKVFRPVSVAVFGRSLP